ncbi:glycosyltransferase family 2 protein [Paenibacillus sp. GD4]|jgi:GT2 family glycosyltransferase|uniref:glycosyltransferase family 2 protein n=1 Tax=Paenibacillus sp. GD4 TaxID=3068890 RepID=UPI002796B8B3|nr:glycosyltransferase family 2 protein [Paenibacillus sp. GD4]MDQ1910400.1 glycosyltransferase family 2 protein [Paenibacillus sp. GD4]
MQFSVCICTRNRPQDLYKALKSLEQSEVPVYQIVVSDDSTDLRTKQLLEAYFPAVRYVPGPKKGLSANRNNALRAVTGTHVLFIDDDVVLARDFFTRMKQAFQEQKEPYGGKLILTGLENKNGVIIYPHDQTFLGFQNRKYKDGEALNTIVINSTVFPAQLFREELFDEQLIYGYEEVDMATRAVRRGYPIRLLEGAVNYHYPSEVNRDYYKPHVETSRLYATFKRYLYTERKRLKAVAFLMVAFLHTLQYGVRSEGKKGFAGAMRSVLGSMGYIRIHRKQGKHSGMSA